MSFETKQLTINVVYEMKELQICPISSHKMLALRKGIFAMWDLTPEQHRLFCNGSEIEITESTTVLEAWQSVQTEKDTQKQKVLWDKLKFWTIAVVSAAPAPKRVNWEPEEVSQCVKEEFEVMKDFPNPVAAKDIPNVGFMPWQLEEVLKAMNDRKKDIFELSQKNRLLEDSEDTSSMVISAKYGRWQQVFDILEKKPYIINAIPGERAWSVLHQAVYHNDCDVVRQLLGIKGCDPEIKAKQDREEVGVPGMTPLELARQRNNSCIDILQNENTSTALKELTLVSTEKWQEWLQYGVPYYNLAAAFLGPDILRALQLNGESFLYITQMMYMLLDQEWQYVRDTVQQSLYPFDKAVASLIGKVESAGEMKATLIKVYTYSSLKVITNRALQRASEIDCPHGDDLLVSLFSLFLVSVLLHWDELEKVTVTTYHGIYLSEEHANLYKKGASFNWLSFTSCNTNRSNALLFSGISSNSTKALFTINNANKSIWSPRKIAPFSARPEEDEVVYPSGAKFTVTDIVGNDSYTNYSMEHSD